MSRPVLILTVTSLVLGASAVYLAVELRATRQELASLRGLFSSGNAGCRSHAARGQ